MIEPRAVISGSFRKHLPAIYELRDFLEAKGVRVLSPIGQRALNPQDEFVLLDQDLFKDERTLQDGVFAKIRQSTFLVLANFDGYLGASATMEIGYAIAYGIQIFTLEATSDPNIRCYTRRLAEVFPDYHQFKEPVPC
jgi:hypothetical protein